jgi:hypothetical protein
VNGHGVPFHEVPERDIQKAILQYLKLRGYECKRNNAGRIPIREGNRPQRWINVGDAGWPDIEGITKEGQYFGIEVKARTGRLTPLQAERGKKIIETKAIWFVARSVDDVIGHGF